MIEPLPFEQSLLARSRDNPWNAVRRLVIEGRYEAIGEMPASAAALPVGKRRQPAPGFLYGAFLQPAEGLLYGAFIAIAAGNNDKATDIFLRALQQLPHLPSSHDFWISLTAFAALPASGGAAEFEALLDSRGMLQIESLNELPLPARSNFLLFCIRHNRLSSASALVERAGPNWNRDEIGFEAWAFRLAALEVLQAAGQHDRLAMYSEAYKHLLEDGNVEPAERTIVEFMLTLRMAEAARARGDTNAAISQYVKATGLAENTAFDAGVLGGLLLKLGDYHSALDRFTEARMCFERCISVFVGESNYDLWRALSSLGYLFSRMGRHPDAVMLYSRRVVSMERDRDCPDIVAKYARLDLARAFLAGGDQTAGRQILDQVIDYAGRGDTANRALLLAAMISRTELGSMEGEGEQSPWRHIHKIMDLGNLSLDELEQVTHCVERMLGSGHRAPEDDVLGRVAQLAETAGSAGGEASEAGRRRLVQRLASCEIAIAETMLREATESELLSRVERLLGGASALPFSQRFALVRLAERAFGEGLAAVGSEVVAALGDLPLPPEPNPQNAVRWGGELYLYLSNLALNRMNDPVRAMTLAERGLEALAGGEAEDGAKGVRQGLLQNVTSAKDATSAEIAAAEAMLGEATESELLRRVERLLGSGSALPFSQRFALVRLAERAFQEGLAAIGSEVVGGLGDLPLPPEPNAQNAARCGGELYLYLSNLALNRMNDPVRAMILAERGLEALAGDDAGDGAEAVRQGLLQNVASAKITVAPIQSVTGPELISAEIAVAETMLEEATESELLSQVERLLGGGTALPFSNRFGLVRLAERAFQEGLAAVGSEIVAVLGDLPSPPEPNAQNAAHWGGELYLYLSNLALNRMNEPVRAMTLAERGLEALAGDDAGDGAEAVRQGLLQNVASAKITVAPIQSVTGPELISAEIAVAETMLEEATESELLSQVERLLGHGLAAIAAQRGSFTALAERAFAKDAAVVGRAILAGVSDLPLGTADPSEAAALLLRLSYLTLTYSKEPARAANLAEKGLDFLKFGKKTDKEARLHRSLSEYLTKARVALASAPSP